MWLNYRVLIHKIKLGKFLLKESVQIREKFLNLRLKYSITLYNYWEKDGSGRASIYIYYTYLKPTWGYGFNFLVVLCVGLLHKKVMILILYI